MSTPLDLANQMALIAAQLQAALAPAPTTQTLKTAADLTAALKTGGVFTLAPGTYEGNFIATAPITLTGTPDAILTPADLSLPTLTVGPTHDCVFDGFTILNGNPGGECVVVGDVTATTVGVQPVNITLQNLTVTAGAQGGHRGIALHGVNLTVRNCKVTGFWLSGQDTQAIWLQNGPGPYTIDGNYLEASGENILTGGDSIKIPNCVPADIAITNNTCYKPDSWRTNGATVKNAIEIKVGLRVLIENNTVDGCWVSGQEGTPILLTVRNQYGDNPWAIVDQVTVRGNVTKRCTDSFGLSILGSDDQNPSQQTQTVLVEHNLFTDSPSGIKLGNGVMTNLTIQFNTLPAVAENILTMYDTLTPPRLSPLTFLNNVAKSGEYGASGTDLAPGLPALAGFTKPVAFTGNVIETTAERAIPWPAGNTLLAPNTLAAQLDPTTFKYLPGGAGY